MAFLHRTFPLSLVVLFLFITSNNAHTDSSGYETFTDKFGAVINSFKLHVDQKIWDDAKETCENENSHLIIPNTKSEVRVLEGFWNLVPKPGKDLDELHVGFARNPKEPSSWITVLGGLMSDAIPQPWKEQWKDGEPNNVGDIEHCASMKMSTMKYLDVECNNTGNARAFVCEKEIAHLDDPEIDARIRL